MARVKFIRDKEPNILALPASKTVIDGALYVATDTGSMWLGSSDASLLQIKDNIDTNNVFVINLTYDSSEHIYNTDKTFSEIKEALLGGKKAVGIYATDAEKRHSCTFDVALHNETDIFFIQYTPYEPKIYWHLSSNGNPNIVYSSDIRPRIKLYDTLGDNIDGPVTQKVTNSLITYSETEPTDSNCRIWIEI